MATKCFTPRPASVRTIVSPTSTSSIPGGAVLNTDAMALKMGQGLHGLINQAQRVHYRISSPGRARALMNASSGAKDACEKLQAKDLLSPGRPSYSAKVPEAPMKADKKMIVENSRPATSSDGDVSKKDGLEVKNPGEDAADATVVSEFSVATAKEASKADEIVEENHYASLARLIEAGSGSILDPTDDFPDDMMAETFEPSSLFALMKVFSREADAEYIASKNTAERLEKHEAKLAFFRGTGTCPDPPPISVLASISDGGVFTTCFNPLYDAIWLPWAKKVQFIDHRERVMGLSEQAEVVEGFRLRTIGTMFSYAVPSRQVLEYMVQRAPDGKIAELGAGSGYWAALLQRLGADIVAVDNGSEEIYATGGCFPARIKQDGTDFLKGGGADGRALFLCWPRNIHQNSAVLSFLENYSGDTIFFVGEIDDGATFDIVEWADEHQDEGWEVEEKFQIPTWPGIHDVFVCVSKKVAQDQSSVADRPRLALQ